ncbi:uncharacterized protein LOC142545780 [Primulina tabacum]|uniref:uncharacterized protein LOC142545780 n=1 Tax=Primulina tabacum TaxID=48773 RepID=UPI003F5AD009
MASENCVICLVRAMDKLWFHQMILFPKPYSFLFPEIPKTYTQPHTISPDYLSKNTSQSTCVITCQETSPVPSVIILNNSAQREKASIQRRVGNEEITQQTRMARKESRNTRYLDLSTKILKKTMSWKSSGELELEEVKGFMDLGFTFKKENMNRRIMSLIPGLQRIQAYKNDSSNLKLLINDCDYGTEQDEEEVGETNGVMRPYLSEAWLIKRPESPLLNLRIPRVSTAANMKKHLKFWARMVASAIHPESR